MKAPRQLDRLSLAADDVGTGGAYPPHGFIPVWDAELGNGDYFGLYWPYGREKHEPIVCDMLHDEWRLQIAFSSVAVFIDWLVANDWERGDTTVDDDSFVVRRYQEAKSKLPNEPEQAIRELRQICEDFPESTEYWQTLASQLRRVGDTPGSHVAAIRAFASNWAFGMPDDATLRMLRSANGQIDDPLVSRSGNLTVKYGGTKENSNYVLLKECITEYLSSPNPVLGLLLNQNYGYMMSGETTAFQDRYSFEGKGWLEEHSRLCEEYLGDARIHFQ
jgi:hypothetical protein